MSKIEEMLKNEKVEWKKLGEVCEVLDNKRKPISKKDRVSGKYPYYGANGVQDYVNNYIFDGQFILMGEDGSVINKDKSPVLHWIDGAKIWVNNHAHVLAQMDSRYNLKFIYYCLSKLDVSQTVRGTPPKINQANMRNLEIPIPSLKTQEKIVKTLDKFTEYVTELQAELQAELQYRTNQYEYYRNMLLSEEYLNKLSKKFLDVSGEGTNRLCCTTLGDIGKFTRGNGLQKSDFASHGKPVIHYGQIYTKYGFETNEVISFVSEELFEKLRKARQGDILMATTSENIEDVGKCVVWTGNEEIGFSGDMYSYRTTENPKYIAYYFQTAEFQKQKEKKVTGTKLIRIHGDDMEKFSIHLPPLSLQNKIVEILDKFQAILSESKGLLPKEIEERQKQYEYYREKLLTFDVESGKQASKQASKQLIANSYFIILKEAAKIVGVSLDSCEYVELGEICDCYDGTHQTPKYVDNGVPFVSVENIKNIYNTKKYISYVAFDEYKVKPQKGDLFMTRIGDIGTCAIIDSNEDLAYYVTLSLLRPNKKVLNSRFLKHMIESKYGKKELNKRILHTANPIKINLGDIPKIKLHLPPLPVQEYIVSILDKFDILVNDIKSGLPKEIEERKKQYEYYRERLLSFKKS